jgi:hypothetical protein
MNRPQISVSFSVHNIKGIAHIVASSMLTGHRFEPIGGKYLRQYIGRRRDMDAQAQGLQVAYDNYRGAIQ